jgi:hypothetical protein
MKCPVGSKCTGTCQNVGTAAPAASVSADRGSGQSDPSQIDANFRFVLAVLSYQTFRLATYQMNPYVRNEDIEAYSSIVY